MKKSILLILAVTLFALSSCLKSSDDNPQNFSVEYRQTLGQYNGKMYALEYGKNLYPDTLQQDVSATVTSDSIITFSSFPLHFLVKELDEEPLRQAIEEKGTTSLKVKYYIYSSNSDYYFTYFIPQSVVVDNVFYDGATHKVTICFVYPSEGLFYSSEYAQIPMYLGGIYVDDLLRQDFTKGKSQPRRLLQFQGEK